MDAFLMASKVLDMELTVSQEVRTTQIWQGVKSGNSIHVLFYWYHNGPKVSYFYQRQILPQSLIRNTSKMNPFLFRFVWWNLFIVNAQICLTNIDFLEYSGTGGGKFLLTLPVVLPPVVLLGSNEVLFSDRHLVLNCWSFIWTAAAPKRIRF